MTDKSNAFENKRNLNRNSRALSFSKRLRHKKDEQAVGECSSAPVKRGKNKRNNTKATILSWLIDTETVEENAQVFIVDKEANTIIGTVQREGILCYCCSRCSSVPRFHADHGGMNYDHKYYESTFIFYTGATLSSYMIQAWNSPKESKLHKSNIVKPKDENDTFDDSCLICANGGDLTCCDGCSSTCHHKCVGLEVVPEDSWYCAYCVCKFCPGSLDVDDSWWTCPLCEKRYHLECQQNNDGGVDLNSIPLALYCDRTCEQVFDRLASNLLGQRIELGEGYSWTLLRRMDDEDKDRIYGGDAYWMTMHNSKLAVARTLLENCFVPSKDRLTRINIIASVVYSCSSNFWRINFSNFYTAVLEKDEEIISVATLRIRGTKLAEMPYIATSLANRCKGMCRKMMDAIVSALRYLNVESLVIPSVPERISSWKERYGFSELAIEMKNEITRHNTLMFSGLERLQKRL